MNEAKCDRFFVGRHVVVEIDGYEVPGKLLSCQEGSIRPHRPNVLILKTNLGKTILRGSWTAIKSFGRVS